MKNDNDSHFLFAIIIVLSICLAALAVLCGEEIMKCLGTKITLFVLLGIFLFIILGAAITLGIAIFNECKCDETKSWVVYKSSKTKIPDDTECLLFVNSEKNDDAKKKICNLNNLKFLDFGLSKWEFPEGFFTCCKNLEEITFFQKPEGFRSNEFSKCLNLKKIILVGNKSDWKNFEICVPIDCEIVFEESKTVVVGETD